MANRHRIKFHLAFDIVIVSQAHGFPLVGFGAVPFETEPHRVTEYAKTARPYSISCRADLLPVCRKFRYRGEDTPLMLQNIRERHGSCPGYNNSKQSTPEE